LAEVDWEQDWLRATSVIHLFARMGRMGIARSKAGRRRLRLLACALCRRGWEMLDERGRAAVEVAERYADGRATEKERTEAQRQVGLALLTNVAELNDPEALRERTTVTPALHAGRAAYYALLSGNVREIAVDVNADVGAAGRVTEALTVRLIRCILGNPYRPAAIPAAVLAWGGGTVVKLARSIDEERRFQDMGVLADALEEAGCTDAAVLAHCRGPGLHAYGCHVLDAVLGRPNVSLRRD
jgi:hypothetical protein